MDGFKATLINEMEKLYKKKKVFVAIILSLLIVVIGQLLVLVARSGLGIRGVESLTFPIVVLSFVINTVIPLFTALVSIDIFSGEFSQNTMKIALTRPITRFKLFLAKIVCILLFVIVNLFLVLIFSLIAGFMFNINTSSFVGVFKLFSVYAISTLPIMVLSLMIVLFANIFRSGVGVFFVSILVFLSFKILGILFSGYSILFFTSSLDWYNLLLSDVLPVSRMLSQFMILISTGIMLFTASYYIFDKKEF